MYDIFEIVQVFSVNSNQELPLNPSTAQDTPLKNQNNSTGQPLITDLFEQSRDHPQPGSRVGEDARHASLAANFPV